MIRKYSQEIPLCELIIKTIDFVGDSEWELIFDRKINVKIADREFLDQVQEGNVEFSGKTKLVCDLSIHVEMDEDFEVLSAKYIVTRVYGLMSSTRDNSEIYN